MPRFDSAQGHQFHRNRPHMMLRFDSRGKVNALAVRQAKEKHSLLSYGFGLIFPDLASHKHRDVHNRTYFSYPIVEIGTTQLSCALCLAFLQIVLCPIISFPQFRKCLLFMFFLSSQVKFTSCLIRLARGKVYVNPCISKLSFKYVMCPIHMVI